jgi:uncharacterized RDD family membrane protein YckC
MTGGPAGPGDPRPPEKERPSDPAHVTAPYAPPTMTSPTPADPSPQAAPPSPGAPPTGTGLPPGVGWAPAVPVPREIAPGLALSDTLPRVVAWVIDGFVLAVIGAIIGGILGVFGFEPRVPPVATGSIDDYSALFTGDVYTVVGIALSAVYFIGSWSGGRRATFGQRLMRIQVGNAFDGRALTLDQAVRRWLLLGEVIFLLGLIPGLSIFAGLYFTWLIVLLATTITSATKQGLHDRVANSAVVRPVDAGNGVVMACAIIAIILAALALFSIVALIFLGGQVSSILSDVGESI